MSKMLDEDDFPRRAFRNGKSSRLKGLERQFRENRQRELDTIRHRTRQTLTKMKARTEEVPTA